MEDTNPETLMILETTLEGILQRSPNPDEKKFGLDSETKYSFREIVEGIKAGNEIGRKYYDHFARYIERKLKNSSDPKAQIFQYFETAPPN